MPIWWDGYVGGTYERQRACGVVCCTAWSSEVSHHLDGEREQC